MKMEKYTTWEMIKALTLNPTKRFRTKTEHNSIIEVFIDLNGYLDVDTNGCAKQIEGNVNIFQTWEEILSPVSFQEAIEAYLHGRTIKFERGDMAFYQLPTARLGLFKYKSISGEWHWCDKINDGFLLDEVENGKFYVID
jgi:hypothetical protein